MTSICGIDCCSECSFKGHSCPGCAESGGHPCGGTCAAAERILQSGFEGFAALKQKLIGAVNGLGIDGLSVSDLNLLNGWYVNLEYTLPNGQTAKFLNDKDVYFGNQIEQPGGELCYGLVSDGNFILVSEYGRDGSNPKLVLYKAL